MAALLGGFHDAVTDRRPGAVPKTLTGVLVHGPQGVLGVLLGLVLVEQGHDLPDHVAHRVVAELLGDRHQPYAALGEAADIELELELVTEEPAEAVHDDHVKRRWLGRRRIDHPLEFWPTVIGRGDAGLDVVGDNLPAAGRAIGPGLAALVRDGEVVVRLPAGRDPEVKGGTNRSGHGDLPSVARREQLVEQVTEPGFEDLDLGLGHRHVLGPIVGHGPAGRVVRHRAARATCARTCIVVHIKWLVACAVVDSGCACARHARTVARDFRQKNGRCARGATPGPTRRSQRKPCELRRQRVTSASRCLNWR